MDSETDFLSVPNPVLFEGVKRTVVQEKPFQKSFTKDSALAYMLQQCFDQLWDHPFVNSSPTPPPPSNVVHQKRTHFHPFRSQVNIVWSGSHLSFTDITGEFPTLLTSYAVWVQHWSQTFLCCQWNGVNLQATFQQLFWNYCIIIQKWQVLQLLNSAKINV